MRRNVVAIAFAIAGVSSLFAACKSNEVNQSTSTTNNFISVGPNGETVPGPDNTMIQVPPGALTNTISMGILVAEDDEYPPLGTVQPLGKVYSFLPHGASFLIDATITMPATNGDVDIYRAQPNGTWELFAKPKANNGLVKFRTSGLSFYAAATGTGGCVRSEDCISGQSCVDKKCAAGPVADGGTDGGGGSDAGTDSAVLDGGPDASGSDGGSCAVPAPSGTSSTVSATLTAATWLSGVATAKAGPDGGGFQQDIRIKIGDFADSCAYATDGKMRANTKMIFVDLFRSSTTALPPAWAAGTYDIGMRSGSYDERVGVGATAVDGSCMPGGVPMVTGKVTIDTVTTTRVVGSFVVDGDDAGLTGYSGMFDVPICNTMSGATSCCVK